MRGCTLNHGRLPNAFPIVLCLAFNAGASQAQGQADSLRLRYARIRAQPTAACSVVVRTSGSMNIEAQVSPTELRAWIDSARAIAAYRPTRAKGQRVRLAWIPVKLGFMRTITDRFDAVALTNSGHEIPILRSELPRIVRLFSSAAEIAETVSACSGPPRIPTSPHNGRL